MAESYKRKCLFSLLQKVFLLIFLWGGGHYFPLEASSSEEAKQVKDRKSNSKDILKYDFFNRLLEAQKARVSSDGSLLDRWRYYRYRLKRPRKNMLSLDERIMKMAYCNYRERVVTYMDKKILKLRSARMHPPIYVTYADQVPNDFSPTYFKYFANSFERLKVILQTLEEPQLFLVPLLKLTIKIYEAAKKSAGRRAIYPGEIQRRGVPVLVLEGLYQKWEDRKRLINHLSLTTDCSRILQNLIPIIDRGFSLSRQLNGQPARNYITPKILQSMIKTVNSLIRSDMKIES